MMSLGSAEHRPLFGDLWHRQQYNTVIPPCGALPDNVPFLKVGKFPDTISLEA